MVTRKQWAVLLGGLLLLAALSGAWSEILGGAALGIVGWGLSSGSRVQRPR